MFNYQEVRDRINEIRERKLMTLTEITRYCDVSWPTLLRFLNSTEDVPMTMRTKKSLLKFIKRHKE